MVLRVWPVDAVTGAPSYTGRSLRQTQAPFLAGATSARPLGSLSGVRPGTPSSTVTATATTWTVTPFAGVIDGQASAIAGPYAFAVDANVTGAVDAANATNPRVDIVYVKVSDPAESDGSTVPAIEVLYLAGTAAASPVAPATPARSFVLANINVPTSGGGSPTVTWKAPYAVAAGGAVAANNYTELALITGVPAGTFGMTIDTGSVYRYNGTGWAAINAVSTVTVVSTTGTSNTVAFWTLAFASVPYATTIDLDWMGEGFQSVGAGSLLSAKFATTAGTLTQATVQRMYSAAINSWLSIPWTARLALPANTAATVTLVSDSNVGVNFNGIIRTRREAV